MLHLHETIRVSHLVACPIVFFCYGQGWERGVFKVRINDHLLVFVAVWVLFPKFLGR